MPSGGQRKDVLDRLHIGAALQIRLNHPCALVAMQPACQITLTTCYCYIYSTVLLLRVLLTLDVGVIKQRAPSYTPFTRYNRLYNPVWQPAVYTIQPFVKPVVNGIDNRLNVCIHDTTGCQTNFTTGLTTGLTTGCIVYTNIYLVVIPVWQQVVSCKRGFRSQSVSGWKVW